MGDTGELSAQALAAAEDAIVTVDARGVITSWNLAAEGLLGACADQAIGQTLALIVPPPHRASHVAAFHAAMSGHRLAHDGQPARVEAMTASGELLQVAPTLGLLTAPARWDGRSGRGAAACPH